MISLNTLLLIGFWNQWILFTRLTFHWIFPMFLYIQIMNQPNISHEIISLSNTNPVLTNYGQQYIQIDVASTYFYFNFLELSTIFLFFHFYLDFHFKGNNLEVYYPYMVSSLLRTIKDKLPVLERQTCK